MKQFYKFLDKEEGVLTQEEKELAFETANNYLEGALITQKKEESSLRKLIAAFKVGFAKEPDEETLHDLVETELELEETLKQTARIKALVAEYNKDIG